MSKAFDMIDPEDKREFKRQRAEAEQEAIINALLKVGERLDQRLAQVNKERSEQTPPHEPLTGFQLATLPKGADYRTYDFPVAKVEPPKPDSPLNRLGGVINSDVSA
jgi:hypothetical protein